MSLLDVHVQLLLHCISIIDIQSSNSLKKIRQTIHIRGPTIEMDEGPQGPVKIRLLRPMLPGKRVTLANSDISPELICHLFVRWELMKKDMSCATERLHTVSPQYFSPFVQLVSVSS